MTFFTKYGTPCFHEGAAIDLIEEIVSNFDPDIVVELGTKNGGFTEVLQESTKNETEIYSYDNRKYPIGGKFRDNVIFITCDVLSGPVDSIVEACCSDRKVLLYCDNGDKQREFILYTKYLKKGDMLGVHDWGTEIFYENIKHCLEGFTFIRRKDFRDAGWKTRFWKRG